MSKTLITPKDWPEIEYPSCPGCGLEMWLIRIAPQSVNREVRTYGCAVCDSFAGGDVVARQDEALGSERTPDR